MVERLDQAQIDRHLSELSGWTLEDNSIAKRFEFVGFVEAFGFMTRVALVCEKMNHHPDWANTYRWVDVRLTTHSANGLTQLDFKLARAMDRLAAR